MTSKKTTSGTVELQFHGNATEFVLPSGRILSVKTGDVVKLLAIEAAAVEGSTEWCAPEPKKPTITDTKED